MRYESDKLFFLFKKLNEATVKLSDGVYDNPNFRATVKRGRFQFLAKQTMEAGVLKTICAECDKNGRIERAYYQEQRGNMVEIIAGDFDAGNFLYQQEEYYPNRAGGQAKTVLCVIQDFVPPKLSNNFILKPDLIPKDYQPVLSCNEDVNQKKGWGGTVRNIIIGLAIGACMAKCNNEMRDASECSDIQKVSTKPVPVLTGLTKHQHIR